MPVRMECAPAFNYARDKHTTSIISDDSIPDVSSPTSPADSSQKKALFQSDSLSLDLRYVSECTSVDESGNCLPAHDNAPASPTGTVPAHPPNVELKKLDLSAYGHLGEAVYCDLDLQEGQAVTFVLRVPPEAAPPKGGKPTQAQADALGVPIQSTSGVMYSL